MVDEENRRTQREQRTGPERRAERGATPSRTSDVPGPNAAAGGDTDADVGGRSTDMGGRAGVGATANAREGLPRESATARREDLPGGTAEEIGRRGARRGKREHHAEDR